MFAIHEQIANQNYRLEVRDWILHVKTEALVNASYRYNGILVCSEKLAPEVWCMAAYKEDPCYPWIWYEAASIDFEAAKAREVLTFMYCVFSKIPRGFANTLARGTRGCAMHSNLGFSAARAVYRRTTAVFRATTGTTVSSTWEVLASWLRTGPYPRRVSRPCPLVPTKCLCGTPTKRPKWWACSRHIRSRRWVVYVGYGISLLLSRAVSESFYALRAGARRIRKRDRRTGVRVQPFSRNLVLRIDACPTGGPVRIYQRST